MELQSNRVGATEIKPASFDIGKLVNESTNKLHAEKTKRVRRTKAEIEAARGLEGRAPLTPNPSVMPQTFTPRDRTKELAPVFKMFSNSFLAVPLECPGIAFNDEESENLARVTSDLMNAFPEYFNQADPKTSAIVSALLVAGPLAFMKYKIYQAHVVDKNRPKTETLEIK